MMRMEVEEQEGDLDFDIDNQIPKAQWSVKAPSASKQNNKDVRVVSQSISLIKQFNPHLKSFELTRPNNKLKFTTQFTSPDKQFKRSASQACKIIQDFKNKMMREGYEIKNLKEKDNEQIVVVRVIRCQDDQATVEDESGMQNLKIENGLLWIGMIVAMKVIWQMGKYYFKQIISTYSSQYQPTKNHKNINPGNSQTKITTASGPYMDPVETEWLGLHLLKKVAQQNNSNTIILMGPFLDYNHPIIQQNKSSKTYYQLMNDVIDYMSQKLPFVDLYLVPSTHDIIHLYPLPQPKYNFPQRQNIIYLGNPSYIESKKISIEVINHDFVQQIRNNLAGRVSSQLLQKIYDSYLKQPMILSCTGDAPVAQNKLSSMYLDQRPHGKIILFSSRVKQANIMQRDDTLFINVGSMMGNTHRIGNIVNMTVYDSKELQCCESVYVEINKLTY